MKTPLKITASYGFQLHSLKQRECTTQNLTSKRRGCILTQILQHLNSLVKRSISGDLSLKIPMALNKGSIMAYRSTEKLCTKWSSIIMGKFKATVRQSLYHFLVLISFVLSL